jgi:hypothetical protein|tara:strand:- start:5043 stop:5156 length:114 start_codon:yes stop_codon:yes gene_type:complete
MTAKLFNAIFLGQQRTMASWPGAEMVGSGTVQIAWKG